MAQLELKTKNKRGVAHETWGKQAVRELIADCHAARQPSAA
jgi:hypothetical protein